MRIPDSLTSLVDEGIIEDVVRPLMSGKEAQVFLVRSGGELRVAKVYKHAQDRTFKHRAQYTEGRTVRNSRDQRAIDKRTRHGRAQDETAWRSAEVDMIYRLRAAGVRVPVPHHYFEGVLIMELVTDAEGNPAPRLGDLRLPSDDARKIFEHLLAEVVRMLSAGVVHGDLSDFNVLMGTDGPVIIDFPQSVNAAGNQNARKLLLRDVDNLHRFVAPYFPERQPPPYAQEMWRLYERGELTPDTRLSGRYRASEKKADTAEVLLLIADAEHDERRRRERLGTPLRGSSNRQVVVEQRRPTHAANAGAGQASRGPVTTHPAQQPQAPHDSNRLRVQAGHVQDSAATPKRKRRRRRRRGNAFGAPSTHATIAPAPQSGPTGSVKDSHRRAGPPPAPSQPKTQASVPGGRRGAHR